MTIRIVLFDVGHGDSIVIECVGEERSYWMVVDCNTVAAGTRCPAEDYLKLKGVTEISALVITHLHDDHYSGVERLLDGFAVKSLYVPPFLSRKDEVSRPIFDRAKKELLEISRRNKDKEILGRAMSLGRLFAFIKDNPGSVVAETQGPRNVWALPGFPDLVIETLLPLARIKGTMHARLTSDALNLKEFGSQNEMSIALRLQYGGQVVVLGGDSERSQWSDHRSQMERQGISQLDASVVKVPHHGSKYNSDKKTISYLTQTKHPTPSKVILLVSANGTTHPHKEYFEAVGSLGYAPYCTGLSTICESQELVRFPSTAGLPREAIPFVENYARPRSVPCQGNIRVDLSPSGGTEIGATQASPCPYRPLSPARRIALNENPGAVQ